MEFLSSAGSGFLGGRNLGNFLFPGAGVFWNLGRPQSESILPQSESDPSSRPPFVAVMQSADLRQFNDRAQVRQLNRSGLRCIFLQRQVRSRPVVIIEVQFERASQRRFVEDDDVVQTLTPDRSDQSPRSGKAMARIGLRMMPTFPSPPLKFRTAGFPRYRFKAGLSDEAFPAYGFAIGLRALCCHRRLPALCQE